jgi:hypothetical protein
MRGTIGWVIALVAAVLCHATVAQSRPWGSSGTKNSNHGARKGSKHGFFLSTPSSFLTAWLSSAVVPTSDKAQRRTLHRKLAAEGDDDEDDEEGSDVEEEEEEESTEAESEDSEDSSPKATATQRDNVGHDQSNKIKLAPKKASATIDDDGDDGDDDAEAKKSTDVDADTPSPPSFQLSLLKQFAPTIVYMVASRFIMKLNFADSGVVQMCRIIFAVYLLLSQVLFTVLKQRIEAANDR